jgi:AsmA-like C-terminal region/Protein of unknown function
VLRHSGQAAIEMGHAVHRVCVFLLTLAVLFSIGIMGAAWRLSRGPVELDRFKGRVEAAVNNSINPLRVTIGGVSIAWRGFSHGLNQPLVLRVTDLTVADPEGTTRAHVPVAEAALSARWLLAGRIFPRAITLEGAALALTRNADGSVNFDLGGPTPDSGPSPLVGLLAVLAAPRETDLQAGRDRLSQLSAVSIHDATLKLDDRLLGLTWSADRADIDLTRHRGGGMDGQATFILALGGQKAVLGGKFSLPPSGQSAHVVAHLSQVRPKGLAATAPILAPLAALDAPLTVDAEADLAADFTPAHIRLTARAGAGAINTARGAIPLHRAEISLAGTLEHAAVESGTIEVQPNPTGPISTLGLGGQVTHEGGRLGAALHLTLDHVGFVDLATLWPADVATNARTWITENVQAGTAHDGKADLVLDAADDLSGLTLTKATATVEGDDLAVAWLPTVPRIEQGKAHVVLSDPDNIEIDVRSGRQRVRGADPIAIQNARITIDGLSQKDQTATIRCDAAGSVVSAIALLREPRLGLLDRHPMDLRAPAGDIRMTLHAVVPLEKKLLIDDVTIRAGGTLSKVHLAGIAAGRDLDDGMIAFDVDTSHLSIKGTGAIAGVAANIDGLMDFRSGPPSQVLQKYTVTGQASARNLAEAGLDMGNALSGDFGVSLVLSEYRNGDGELIANADFTQAGLNVSPLGWRKPAGGMVKVSGRVSLSNDKLAGIDRLVIDGPGVSVRGAVTVFNGKPDTVRLDRLVLGRTDVTGTIRFPRDGPIGLDVSGPALDLGAKLLEKSPKRDPSAPLPPPGPAWSMRGRFDHVFLTHDRMATNVTASVDDDGEVIRGLSIAGKTSPTQAFSMQIAPGPMANGQRPRRLTINAADAGGLLAGLDVTSSMQGGVLTVSGDFNDTTRDHLLSGTLEINDFRVAHAPALGKLLQAVTLYGLVDALGGPGLSFSLLTAPFDYDSNALVLRDARAFSPSLGLTAKGRIDRDGDHLDVGGTLVPAYVFNSLLGRIPLIGALFSAEKGGGLFAMNYSLRGPADNPSVVANPFSALTPGILRGMFGIFDQPAPGQAPPLDRQSLGGNPAPP